MRQIRGLIAFFLIAVIVVAAWPPDFAEAAPAHLRARSSRRIVKAIRTNTRQIFKPTFTIRSSHAKGMTDARFSLDGKWFASSSKNNAAQLWSMATGQRELDLSGHSGAVLAVTFVPNSNEKDYGSRPQAETRDAAQRKGVLVTGSADGRARLWSMVTGKTIRSFKGHKDSVTSVAVTPNKKFLITGSLDKTAKLWDLKRGKLKHSFKGHSGPIHTVAIAPKGKHLATGSEDGTIRIWDLFKGSQLQQLTESDGPVQTLAWSTSGRYIVSGHSNGAVRLWETFRGFNSYRLSDHDGAVHGVAFSQDNTLLASVGEDAIVRLWSISGGKPQKRFEGHQKSVKSVAFSRDATLLLTASDDRTLRLWKVQTGTELARLVSMRSGWAVVTPDGRFDGSLDGDLEDRLDAIQWSGENHSFALDGFIESYYRPALLGRLLSKKKEDKRVASKKKNVPNVTEGFYLPPRVEIKKPNVSTTQKTVSLQTEAKDLGGGVNEIRLYHNEKIVTQKKSKKDVNKEDGIVKTTYEVTLVDGKNVFRLVGLSDDRIESEPHSISLDHKPRERLPDPKLNVFVVGINTYANPALNLDFAVPDAKGMLGFFMKSHTNLFKQMATYEIYNKKATKRAIDRELSGLYKIPAEDTVVLYFAGHGESIDDSWYFIPHDLKGTNKKAVREQGVSSEKFKQHISSIGAHKIVLLFDACKSGAAMSAFAKFENQRPMALLSRSTGIHIATATTGKQYASELTDLGHGVFTYALLAGLKGKADRKPKDGNVSIEEILQFTQRYVPFLTKKYGTGAMTPVTTSRGDNFRVSRK